ncbi:MAG: alpha/beta hydrolase family protein [Myxococcota bacterium]
MVVAQAKTIVVTGVAVALFGAGCLDGGDSKSSAGAVTADQAPFGPKVVYDPLRRPIAEVPFPNDLLLHPVDDTVSGKAWNLSLEAPTGVERRVRRKLNELDGFGTFAPIFVSFEGPLDLSTVDEESVRVVNIEPGHPREGEIVPLDLGRGYFPVERDLPPFWGQDPNADVTNLLFPPDNLADEDGDGDEEFVSHYEVATHTLILRPVIPLAQDATHAVLITRDVMGWAPDQDPDFADPAPVRSPFAYKAHAAQEDLVAGALDLLDMDSEDLAFGWTYTTADLASSMMSYRDAVYGEGPLGWIGERFEPVISDVHDNTVTIDGDPDQDGVVEVDQDHRFILQPVVLREIFNTVAGQSGAFGGAQAPQFDYVDYFVFGAFDSPDMRTGEANTFGVDPFTGEGEIERDSVPFFASIPKTTAEHQPPFPVALYFHGTATSRMEALAICDAFARQGIATVAFDQVGHGPIIPSIPLALEESGLEPSLVKSLVPLIVNMLVPEQLDDYEDLEWWEAIDKLNEVGLWRELALYGRTEDENGDGSLQSSESFFFADPFRQCASFWQDIVDIFRLVRIVRSLDPEAVPDALDVPSEADPDRLRQNLLAGDFNADGVLDIGGPDVQLSVAGTSLGGFHATLAAALEPEITVATPIVAGGGFMDIMTRSRQRAQTQWIFLETFGPLVVGCPDGEGGVWLSFNDDTDQCDEDLLEAKSFAHLDSLPHGTFVRIDNVDNGESSAMHVRDEGFSLAIPSDRWDQLEITIRKPEGEERVIPVQCPYEGTAFQRNTSRFRRFLGISQHVLDRCDPISFARNLFVDPLPGHPPTNVLFEMALGDRTVPISTGMMLALASGVFGTEREEWEPIMDTLIDQGSMLNGDYDVDDLWDDNPEDQPPIGPLEPVPSGSGVSTVRFADVDGHHEWIAGHVHDVPSAGPDVEFDAGTYSQSQLVLYHLSGGRVVVDDLCIQEQQCPLLEDPSEILEK